MKLTKYILPTRCFISHSYRDGESLTALRSNLPHAVLPFIFPPITVSPEQFVSTFLIDAILSQEGLIYIVGGLSGESFWVYFERDYGLRSKRIVFSFDVEGSQFLQDVSEPREILVYPSYARQDVAHVETITEYMRQRHFSVWVDCAVAGNVDIETNLRHSIQDVLGRGGYAVLFWSHEADQSSFIEKEMEWVWTVNKGRILIAMLEDVPPPSWLQSDLPPWLQPVQLFGDDARSEMNRWDDLIVRLFWLVYNIKEL